MSCYNYNADKPNTVACIDNSWKFENKSLFQRLVIFKKNDRKRSSQTLMNAKRKKWASSWAFAGGELITTWASPAVRSDGHSRGQGLP